MVAAHKNPAKTTADWQPGTTLDRHRLFMAHVRASSTTSNSNLVGCKRVANQRSRPEIYHLFFVRVRAGAPCLPEHGNRLWSISASHWPISGSLVPVLPFP